MFERLLVALQYVLPKRLLGRLVYRVSRSRVGWLKNGLIRGFKRLFAVDLAEAAVDEPFSYASLNAFFTRELVAGARPVDPDPALIACPADGTIQQVGRIAAGQLLQAKGMSYRLDRLLAVDANHAARFDGGAFLTIYLAPHDYHRVHAPTAGRVRRMHVIPGHLFSVNETTARLVPGLFAGNARVACECVGGPADYWLVLVGALNVASISTAWAGELPQRTAIERVAYQPEQCPALAKGEYFGHFNMGSTVIVVYPPGSATWDGGLTPGDAVRAGAGIGRL
jgi:phosphatidylserine decarboxylase